MEIEQANSILEEAVEPVVEVETKAKKPLSEDRLAKLQKARERASEVAKEKREKKEPKNGPDPVVVIEQSDSDSEDLEGPPGVIFVRRKRSKPKAQSDHEMNFLFSSMFGSRSY